MGEVDVIAIEEADEKKNGEKIIKDVMAKKNITSTEPVTVLSDGRKEKNTPEQLPENGNADQ